MCLDISVTRDHHPERSWPRTYYKVYRPIRDSRGRLNLGSPIRGALVTGPGIVSSNRLSTDIARHEAVSGSIGLGIHVFTDPVSVEDYRLSGEKIIEVECEEDDLVSFGKHKQAVFTKIKISAAQWARIAEEEK